MPSHDTALSTASTLALQCAPHSLMLVVLADCRMSDIVMGVHLCRACWTPTTGIRTCLWPCCMQPRSCHMLRASTAVLMFVA